MSPPPTKANVDYGKWANLKDEDDDAAALAEAEREVQRAQFLADAAASAALTEAGGKVEAVPDQARAAVQAKVAVTEEAQAKVAALREAAAAKAAAEAASARVPTVRTVQRRKWDEWDKVKLDLSDDDA